MKAILSTYFLCFFLVGKVAVAQPGWYGVGGQLNDISEENIQNCLNNPSRYRLKYVTIDSSTNLNRLYLLKEFSELSLKIDLIEIPISFPGNLFYNLEQLFIVGDRINDISGLSKLPHLYSLTLVDYSREKLPSGLGSISSLKNFEIFGDIENADGIKKLNNLEYLSISSPYLNALPLFQPNNKIIYLKLNCPKEGFDFNNLSQLTNLETLYLYEPHLFEFPNNLTHKLKEIIVFRSQSLSDVSNLSNYPALEFLTLYDTGIEELPDDSVLLKISCINIFGNSNLSVVDQLGPNGDCQGIYSNGR